MLLNWKIPDQPYHLEMPELVSMIELAVDDQNTAVVVQKRRLFGVSLIVMISAQYRDNGGFHIVVVSTGLVVLDGSYNFPVFS